MTSSIASKLDGLLGLEGAKRAAARLVRPDSGVHAALLYGAEGSGKRVLAETLAQSWLCTRPTGQGACGECPACEAFARDRSADLLRVQPGGLSNWIRVMELVPGYPEFDGIPVLDFLRTTPLAARHKVVFLTDVDRLTPDAANAFLKTLEEPPPYAKIVMTTTYIGRVLPTVVSRCVTVACELPPVAALAQDAAWPGALAIAEGAPGRLAHVLSHEGPYRSIAEIAQELPNLPVERALATAERFRAACDALEKELDCGARAAYVEGLRALGACVAAHSPRDPWMSQIAEAHRRVQGNGSAGLVTDALFARMLLAAR